MMQKPLSSIVSKPFVGPDVSVSGLTLDSRKVQSGDLFVALKGDASDGHHYIGSAFEKGAVAVAVEQESAVDRVRGKDVAFYVSPDLRYEVGTIAARFFDMPTHQMKIAGVTGTNGKTTICDFIAQLLQSAGESCGRIGTLGVQYKDVSVEGSNTTPDAIALQKTFREMLDAGVSYAAMEASSHALVQGRCVGVEFDVAVFSNITHEHLDYHGSFDEYLAAKSLLFRKDGLPLAVINKDDEACRDLRKVMGKDTRVLTYSLSDATADVYFSSLEMGSDVTTAVLHYGAQNVLFKTGLTQAFNLYNLLAALIVVSEQGFGLDGLVSACRNLQPAPGRMQRVANTFGIAAYVDYAHTPDALENVLKSVNPDGNQSVITIFGCGGDRDKDKRPAMASIAEAYSSKVIVTSDNPRTEAADQIINDILAGFSKSYEGFEVFEDRQAAIRHAVSIAETGDVLLLAGKGNEKQQVIGTEKLPFDDVEELHAAFQHREELGQ